jgi:general secretion pathway protein G
MLIVRFIAAILAGSVTAVEAQTGTALRVEVDIQGITAACSNFQADYGVFPPQTNWFAELTASTNAVLNRHRTVFLNARVTKDPWGKDVVYHCPGKHNTSGVDIYSCGKDGQSSSGGNDPDDINNWDTARPWRQYYSGFQMFLRQFTVAAGAVVFLLALFWIIRRQMKTELHGPPNAAPRHR